MTLRRRLLELVDGNLSCQNGPLGQRRYPAKEGLMIHRSRKRHKITGSVLAEALPDRVTLHGSRQNPNNP